MSRGETSHEFSGAKAKERAMAILDTYDEEVIDYLKIEIEETYRDITETEADTDNNSEKKDHDGEKEGEEVKRELGEISSGTNHQTVLFAIQRLDDEAPVEATRIEEWISNNMDEELKRGSIFGALHDLYERRLIDRQNNEQNNHEYQITVHGDDQIQKVGEP
jgi:DNA-binding PadR family transcriptional regulator